MNKYFAMFVFALTLSLLTIPANSYAIDHFILHYIELTPEASITEAEMKAWKTESKSFAKSERKLASAYEDALEEFGPGGESWLRMNQTDWAKNRQQYAYQHYPPKGSPNYLNYLSQHAAKRTDWLDQLADKSSVVFAHNYIYQKSGYEGMIILYYRNKSQEMQLYTRNLKSGAVCKAIGEAVPSEGKAHYDALSIEMIELGKSLDVTASATLNICQPGGNLVGSYILTK